MVAIGFLTKLATALVSGDDSVLSKIITNKLESMGEEFVLSFLPQQEGGISRITEALKTGGESEFNRLRNEWLHALTPTPLPGENILETVIRNLEKTRYLATRPKGKYQVWSRSRQEWLDEGWRHNWRSQPRDPHGRWEPGRLRHPYVSKGARRMRLKRRQQIREAIKKRYQYEERDGN